MRCCRTSTTAPGKVNWDDLFGGSATIVTPAHYVAEALAGAAYFFTLTKNPPEPTISPLVYFPAAPELGEMDLRYLNWQRFFGRLHFGERWRFTRSELFSTIGGPAFYDDGLRAAFANHPEKVKEIVTLLKEPAKEVPELAKLLDLEKAIEIALDNLHKDQRRTLFYLFAQENLFIEVELDGGTQHPLDEFLVPEQRDAPTNGAMASEPSPQELASKHALVNPIEVTIERLAERMRKVKDAPLTGADRMRPQRAEAVFHVDAHLTKDHPELLATKSAKLKVVQLAGYTDVGSDRWSDLKYNGEDRITSGKSCRFCP